MTGGVKRYFQSFINKNNIENKKLRPKCQALYENLKEISSKIDDCIKVLEKYSTSEGRLQLLKSANRDL